MAHGVEELLEVLIVEEPSTQPKLVPAACMPADHQQRGQQACCSWFRVVWPWLLPSIGVLL